ncbi:MAG: glycosyltransferase [Bdellovibrionales bacterium]|nr:glycosyltransferase [Bdellovibrionales bacterium]
MKIERVLVVLPSYNENENIVNLMEAILALGPGYAVCVVDDSSPDGTHELVRRAIESKEWAARAHLIVRAKKDGRGGAVRTGFQWGHDSGRGFQAYVEMDCDFSHEPKSIPTGIAKLEAGADVVLGSRYPDGKIEGWPIQRHVFSFLANFLARTLIHSGVHDFTNGFRFYSPAAVEVLLLNSQKHKGYIYLSESLSQLLLAGMSIREFPIYFKNRVRGVSNTSFAEVKNALLGIFSIAREHRRRRTGRKIESRAG